MKYIVDIKGEIEGDYEIIGKYEERPQGEWIYERPNGKTYSDFVYCSECQKPNGFYITNFCPNCGADMRKGGAEDDG